MTLPHLMSNPQIGRYNEAMRQAERTEMALRITDGAVSATHAADLGTQSGYAPSPKAPTTEMPHQGRSAAPIDFDRIDRYLEAFSRQRKISDARVWQEYTESLERRGLCLCPSCRVKVEKFGQYCETCKF